MAILPNLQLIYVSNITRSTGFYERLLKTKPVFVSPRYVAFGAGDKALFAIWSGGTKPDLAVPRFHEIGIMLPSTYNIDALFEEWKNDTEVTVLREPYNEVFGRTFLVQDPDGHVIRVSPLD